MKKERLFFCFILLFILTSASADNKQARNYIRSGNLLYRIGIYQAAQVNYLKAVEADKTDARAIYNLSTSMFPKEWKLIPDDQRNNMANYFFEAAKHESNPIRKAQAYHNMGVVFQGGRNFQKAIEAYKEALRNNPNDDETRYNLVLCQRQLKNHPEDQNQNQNQNQNRNNQDNQQKQDQQEQQQQQQQQEEQQTPMNKETAEQLLNAAMQQEKKTQERMKEAQKQPRRRRIEKNW